ncbi:MAG: FAD-dependent thymidylate synthase [Desulfotomaculaceae bacterium]|nr:FAD-dependent thymidylate synthase [Desulfotomaculaceae bacterium]
MEIRLISTSPDYLKTIWFAARTCYSPLSPIDLFEHDPPEDEMLRIADRIITMKHLSVLEHCHMTFAVKDVSRTLLAQYSRHRIGVSLSVQSQRWVSEQSSKKEGGIFDFVVPPEIKQNKFAWDTLLISMSRAQKDYDYLLSLGIKKEDARFVLPGGVSTNFVTSLNLRSFFDVYQKRVLVPGAQWEIRKMLTIMAGLLVEREPWLQKYLKA